MTVVHEGTNNTQDESPRRPYARITEELSQTLSHMSPDQARAVFQMLGGTMAEVQADNAAKHTPNRFEEVIARLALEGQEIAELENFSASGDDVLDQRPVA